VINGTADLVKDKAKIKELWSLLGKSWFTLDLKDPDMTLSKATRNEVNY